MDVSLEKRKGITFTPARKYNIQKIRRRVKNGFQTPLFVAIYVGKLVAQEHRPANKSYAEFVAVIAVAYIT